MTRARRLLGASLGALMAAAGLSVVFAADAGAATSVATEAELRAALADPATTDVVLASSIDLTDCTPGGGDLDRAGDLTLDGAGFTLRQTCAGERVLESTSGTLTLTDVTITGGDQSGPGDALGSELGGGVLAAGDLVLDHATITQNRVSGQGALGGGVAADGSITMTASHVDENRAVSSLGAHGAGVFGGAGHDVTIVDSTVDGNVAEMSSSDQQSLYGIGGGGVALLARHEPWAADDPAGTVHASRSSISRNVENAESGWQTFAIGGGIYADAVELESSHVDGNQLHPKAGGDIAIGWGGGLFALTSLDADDSGLDANVIEPNGPNEAAEGALRWGTRSPWSAPGRTATS